MTTHKTIFTTERSKVHQQHALNAAPDILDVTMLHNPAKSELIDTLKGAEFLISERRGVIDSDILNHVDTLKLIVRLGSMAHDIDLEIAKDRGVIVCQQPDEMVIRVAEHCIMQMLAVSKKLNEVQQIALEANHKWGESKRTDANTFAYNWSRRDGIGQLYRRTIGIVGFGEIGTEMAKRLYGWRCTLLYNKRQQLPRHVEDDLNLQYADKSTLFQQSDIIVNLLPYSAATDMSIDAVSFAQMKSGSLLVSVGSGSVIDEHALADAVESGQIAGVALDTYECEPIQSDNPLRQLALRGYNILLTPHTAAVGDAPTDRADDYANILRYLNDKSIFNRLV